MKINILTLFPEMFGYLDMSIIGRARRNGKLDVNLVNFRDFADSKHSQVDDTSFGGGAGMLLKPEPILKALNYLDKQEESHQKRVILLDPAGKKFDQKMARELAKEEELVFICGHYEGYDERIKTKVTDQISLGDYVLTGGELGAMTIIDATARLLPGVLGNDSSSEEESFSSGLLEYPQYTKPQEYDGMKVPDVLLSGHHENIELWRQKMALIKTYELRPDLLETAKLTDFQKEILTKIQKNSI